MRKNTNSKRNETPGSKNDDTNTYIINSIITTTIQIIIIL